jgi:hypothetical protein
MAGELLYLTCKLIQKRVKCQREFQQGGGHMWSQIETFANSLEVCARRVTYFIS